MLVSTTLLLAVLCIILYTVTRSTLLTQFDDSLLSTAKMLSATIGNEALAGHREEEHHEEDAENRDSRTDSERGHDEVVETTPEFNSLNGGFYQIQNHDGSRTVRSPSMGRANLPYFAKDSSGNAYRECVLPNDKPGRLIVHSFFPTTEEQGHRQARPWVIMVGRDASQLYEFLGFFRWLLLNCSIVIVVLSSLVAVKVTKIGIKPVHTLAHQIEAVDEEALEQSFSADAYPLELVPICNCLNALLGRIRNSVQRERRFNADVAHELRTPLAGFQSIIEVCLSRSREPQAYEDALESCLHVSKAMNRLVSTLLALSRLEAQQIVFKPQTIAIRSHTDKLWLNFADQAHDKKLCFDNSIDETLCCVTDKDHLSIILSNMLDNAVEYCDGEGRIVVKARRDADVIVFTLSNTGCRLTPAEVEHVFDFFWRADAARTDTGVHCGIGLALVQKVAELLSIKVKAEIEPNSVFSITLELPTDQSCS
jgi:signal transduction histidine kinase